MKLCFKSVGCDAVLLASQFPTFGRSTGFAPSVSSSARWSLRTKHEIIRNARNYLSNNSVTSQKTWFFSNTALRTYILSVCLGCFNQLPSTSHNLVSITNLMHNSFILYVLHYNPWHVLSNTMLILRRSKLYCYSMWYRHSAVQCTGWEQLRSQPVQCTAAQREWRHQML
jgi:hypothetical protein